ncbi:MAG: hypothetical protein RLZZ598_1396 [Pseudomonadota bacterium]|jgi:hypothetical protein
MHTTLENPMVSGLDRYHARQDRRDALAAGAFTTLRDELIHALTSESVQPARAPGFTPHRQSTVDVISDNRDLRTDQDFADAAKAIKCCETPTHWAMRWTTRR